jgi:DNA-binding SARP family transcriptional activator
MTLRIRVLGPVEAALGEARLELGSPKQRAVLRLLALHAGEVVTADRLLQAVWGPDASDASRASLHTYVSNLRRILDPARTGVLARHDSGYRLLADGEAIELDLVAFRQLAASDDPVDLEAALALWRGDPSGELDPEIGDGIAHRWREERRRVTERLADALLSDDRAADALEHLAALLDDHPLDEPLWCRYATALCAAGRQAAAIDALTRLRVALAEELGVDPSPATAELLARILAHDRSLFTSAPTGGAATGAAVVPFPDLLRTVDTAPYVGRSELLVTLESRWKAAAEDPHGRCVLLAGEPGIGKTRTASELAVQVHEQGGVVLYGRCEDHLAMPFQPFVEALDHQTAHAPHLPLGRFPGDLTRLLPELPQRVDGLPPPLSSDPRTELHRLHEAIGSWLVAASEAAGLVLVVDDLHWATPPTVAAFDHVLRVVTSAPTSRVLLLGAYRDTEVVEEHPMRTTLAEAGRRSGAEVLPVDSLTADEVVDLLEERAGHELDAAARRLAQRTHADTHGNPFFVGEVVRNAIETGAVRVEDGRWTVDAARALAVPSGVRDVVLGRIQRLTPAATEVLRATALVGAEADVDLLAELVGGGIDTVLAGSEAALGARLLVETAPDRFGFTHALVRSTLLDTVSPARRRRLHAQILDVLERQRPAALPALARHAVAAGTALEDPARAVRYSIEAGEQALAQRALGDARDHLATAAALSQEGVGPPALGLRARCGLGEAERDLGDPGYRETLLGAAQGALTADEIELALRAVVANHRPATASAIGAVDRDRLELLDAVLARLPGDAHVARTQVLALLSVELTFDPEQLERRLQLADEAIALAAELGDPRLEAWTLVTCRFALAIPQRTHQLAPLMERGVELADRTGDPLLRCIARVNDHQAALGLGDIERSRRSATAAAALAEELPPFVQLLARAQTVQFLAYAGDLPAAREANKAMLEFGQAAGESDVAIWWGAVEALLTIVSGGSALLVDALRGLADSGIPGFVASLASVLGSAGRIDEAREVLEHHGLDDPERLPSDFLFLPACQNLAVAAFELGHTELGARLVSLLEPWRDQWSHFHTFCQAPVEMAIGLAAGAAGDWATGVSSLQRTIELLRERDMRAHVPWTTSYLVRSLQARAGPGDEEAARHMAAEGSRLAEELGLELLVAELSAGATARVVPDTPRSPGSAPTPSEA